MPHDALLTCTESESEPLFHADPQLKALLREAAERTVDGLWTAIGHFVDVFTRQECANYFAAAGYDAD